MKRITILFFLLASINALSQTETLTKEDLVKELQPLKISIQVLQNENSKVKTEVGYLKNQLASANKNIDSLRGQIQENNSAISQNADNVKTLHLENGKLKSEIKTLNSELSNTNRTIDSLRIQTLKNSNAISQTANELRIKIKETGDKNENKITEVSKSLSKNSLYGIIGVLSAILLSGLLYWLLSKRQKIDKTEVVEQLNQTKTSIEEGLVKEFGKQTELIESQLQLIAQQKMKKAVNANVEPDHLLALKVADQITTIERAVSLMDEKTKGLQRISNSVTNLKDNLAANGYEIVEVIGKQFNQGMNIIVASSIPDKNLKLGKEIITRVIKPQVNYNDKMIQAAQVEVSVGV